MHFFFFHKRGKITAVAQCQRPKKKKKNTPKKQHDGIVLQIFLQLIGILLKLCDYMLVSVLCNRGKEQLRNVVLTCIDIASMLVFVQLSMPNEGEASQYFPL